LNLNINVAWWSLALATPFYVLVYMYLDGIIPNSYGIRQSLCFCVKKRKSYVPSDDEELGD
jgi:hypothetical protein